MQSVTTGMNEASNAAPAGTAQHLAFSIGEESYAIDISHVTEIVGLQKCTEVPDVPHHIRGVINLRGKVIPIMDVRKRFGMPTREDDHRTCIVVVELVGEQVGLVVDRVQEVVDVPEGGQARTDQGSSYVRKIAHVNDEALIVLDTARVLGV